METQETADFGRDKSFSYANIMRTNYDPGNLFGLALSLYYQTTHTMLIDWTKVNSFDAHWIDRAVRTIGDNDVVVFSQRGGNALITGSEVTRRFLLYTDVKYSNTSVFDVFYELCDSRQLSKAVFQNTIGEEIRSHSGKLELPNEFTCEKDFKGSYAVMIPTWKRDYLRKSVTSLCKQEAPPEEIFILQNNMYQVFNFRYVTEDIQVPVRHFWATNWNTYFFLTYVVMMFVPQKYTLKIDDDFFPEGTTATKGYLNFVNTKKNVMVGLTGAVPPDEIVNCGYQITERKVPRTNDHVANVVMMLSSSGKILHRFSSFTYIGGEDIAVSVTNAMECNTGRHTHKFPHSEHHGDGNGHASDPGIQKATNELNVGWIYPHIYCHYIRGGYTMSTWARFNRTFTTNIRLPH